MWSVKTYRIIISLILVYIFLGVSNPFITKAELEPFYNVSVKIEPTITGFLNEKIEVHCEKDGQYYMTIDLNNSNRYEYKKLFENGVYTFAARVRYDFNGEYTVLPKEQVIELSYKNNNVLNEIIFTIEGVSSEPDDHAHVHDEEPDPNIDQGERVYTIDDLEELQQMQESVVSAAEVAFAEQEQWEQNNSFLAQHGVSDTGVPADSNNMLPMHSYPADQEQDDNEVKSSEDLESLSEEETAELEMESSNSDDKKALSVVAGLMVIVLLIVTLVTVLIIVERKRDKYE